MIQGNVGQLRFCLRGDVEPTSLGTCNFEELPRTTPHAADVVCLVKHHMADDHPVRVLVLITEYEAATIRASFVQPAAGSVPRRPITKQVKDNLRKYAPLCAKQGLMSHRASDHLLAWCEGSLPVKPRPASYSFLTMRQNIQFPLSHADPAGWVCDRRMRSFNFSRDVPSEKDGSEDSQSDDNDDPINLD